MYKLGILGVGKMGGAILDGVISSNIYNKEDVLLYTPNLEIKNKYEKEGFKFSLNEVDLFLNSKIILLAIKPQIFDSVLPLALPYDFNNQLIISIAAGKKILDIKKYFKNAKILRAMPNLPASIKKGAITVATLDDGSIIDEGINILSSIGIVVKIKEEEMNPTLPLNGSMPAYAYLFAKAFIDYGVNNGLDLDVARNLTIESIKGSMDMILANPDVSIDTLINNVCSKGGTTIEGLNKLYEYDMPKAIDECCKACVRRNIELAK